jgi:hypothetical protein
MSLPLRFSLPASAPRPLATWLPLRPLAILLPFALPLPFPVIPSRQHLSDLLSCISPSYYLGWKFHVAASPCPHLRGGQGYCEGGGQ